MINADYLIWYHAKAQASFQNMHTINAAYVSWEQHGIVAFLVHVHFRTAAIQGLFPLLQRRKFQRATKMACGQTAAWLAEQSFPAELVECYAHIARKP